MRATLVCALLLASAAASPGCGSEGDCDVPDGNYRTVATEQAGGTCGAQPGTAGTIQWLDTDELAEDSTCIGSRSVRVADDLCSTTIVSKCDNGRVSYTGISKVEQVDGIDRIEGTAEIDARSADGTTCRSVYDVTITRL